MMRRPNLLVILADQLRRDSLSCYGDPNIVTPHIDALAREGMTFEAACSTYPVCVPFRFTLMTGQPAHSRMVPAIEWRMSPAERTFADRFNDVGYDTLYLGKWHLHGGHGQLPGHTAQRANRHPVPRSHQGRWSRWLGFELRNSHFDTCYFEDDDPEPKLLNGYQTDALFDLAKRELERRSSEKPFCCVLSVEPPHPPYEAPKAYEQRWLERDIQVGESFLECFDWSATRSDAEQALQKPQDREQRRRDFLRNQKLSYAMIENLDDNVGGMVDYLKASGQYDETVIVFLSDHGDHIGRHDWWGKSTPFEESVGIPLIIRDPRCPDGAGRRLTAPVCTEDLLPTLCGLADIDSEDLPGYDCSSGESPERAGVLLQYVAELREGFPFRSKTWRAFRSERYLYAVLGDQEGGVPWLLYDLQVDSQQLQNRISAPDARHLQAQLHEQLREALRSAGDDYRLLD